MLYSASTSLTSKFKESITNQSKSNESVPNNSSGIQTISKRRKLHSIEDEISNNDIHYLNSNNRLLLEGPSQCGKTSLLMDVAYNTVRMNHDENDDCDVDNEMTTRSKKTTMTMLPIVTFLTPTKNRPQFHFPLICSSSESSSPNMNQSNHTTHGNSHGSDMSEFIRQEQNFQQQMNDLEQEQKKLLLNNNNSNYNIHSSTVAGGHQERDGCSTFSYNHWNRKDHAKILQRIRIRYIDSIHDLMTFLASIHFTKEEEVTCTKQNVNTTCNCIIIDDLDYFVKDVEDLSSIQRDEDENNVNDEERENQYDTVSKSLFQDDFDQSFTNTKKPNTTDTNNVASTIEMMRLVQLLAHISDVCNHLQRKKVQSSFYTCINTDNLSIPKQFQTLLQSYVSTIATISPTTTTTTHSSTFKTESSFIEKLFNIKEQNSSIIRNNNQISSLWQVCIERNFTKDFLLRINPLETIANHQGPQQQQQLIFQSNALYAIIWTYDQFNDSDALSNNMYGLEDSDDEDIDYDSKEIVWRII